MPSDSHNIGGAQVYIHPIQTKSWGEGSRAPEPSTLGDFSPTLADFFPTLGDFLFYMLHISLLRWRISLLRWGRGGLAQLVAHWFVSRCGVSSSPTCGTEHFGFPLSAP